MVTIPNNYTWSLQAAPVTGASTPIVDSSTCATPDKVELSIHQCNGNFDAVCGGGLGGGRVVLLGEEGFDVFAENAVDAADFMRLEFAVADQPLDRADRDLHHSGGVGGGVDRSHRGDDRPHLSVHLDLQY